MKIRHKIIEYEFVPFSFIEILVSCKITIRRDIFIIRRINERVSIMYVNLFLAGHSTFFSAAKILKAKNSKITIE